MSLFLFLWGMLGVLLAVLPGGVLGTRLICGVIGAACLVTSAVIQ